MPIKKVIKSGQVPVNIYTDDVEPEAYRQLKQLSELPILHSHIAAMPDVHAGRGATVGSVIATRNAIIPAAVGVDIGCGMNAVRLSIDATRLPDNLKPVRAAIEDAVPVGFEKHRKVAARPTTVRALDKRVDPIIGKHPKLFGMVKRFATTWPEQLGTLGGGNHFIELCLDGSDRVWIMLHSGSRAVGNAIGKYFINLARRDMERLQRRLPDKDLAYFEAGGTYFDDYVEAVQWAQDYALCNRKEMLRLVIDALRKTLPDFEITKEAINCHHNYVSFEHHFDADVVVTRKGAIRAGYGELGIIPGSMGARSYIVRGLGNPGSFESCAHGAGRRMSRGKAKREFDTEDLIAQTEGIECRKDKGVLDEIPSAYKNIDEVMANQVDLVETVHELRQVLCVKG